MISDKIMLCSVQLLLYCIHFEIMHSIEQPKYKTTRFWLVSKFGEQKLENFPNNGFLSFISMECDWLVLKALKSDWLFCFE